MNTDVAVIGLGSVGAMALWQLSKNSDLNVVGVEQFGIGHSYGGYAGESRVFRTAYHEGGTYIPLLLKSREVWKELQADSGRNDIFLETGTLSIAEPDLDTFQTALDSIKTYDLPHRYFDNAELRKTYPQHVVNDDIEAVLDVQGGGLRPELAVITAVQQARKNGATVLTNEAVLGIDEVGDKIEVRTTERTIVASQVIIATGSWAGKVQPELKRLVRIVPLGLTWFVPKDISRYTPDVFPTFLRDQEGVHMFGVPALDGFSVKVAAGPEYPNPETPEDLRDAVPRDVLLDIARNAVTFFPDLDPEPIRHSLHSDGYTPDRVPIIDRDPSGRIITVTGLSGHGFKFATGLGVLASDLVRGVDNELYRTEYSIADKLARLDAGTLAFEPNLSTIK